MASGVLINSVQDALAVALEILESAQEEIIWLIPPSLISLSVGYSFTEKTRAFIQRGGISRGIVPVSDANVATVQTNLAFGEGVRHSDEVHELFMFVGDRRESISAINIGIEDFTRAPIIAFRSEDPTYAEFLLASFENAWNHAVPAAQRMHERVV